MSQHKVTVRILDKEYQFAATDEERPSLIAAADYLDNTMRTIKNSNSGLSIDNITIMAALNISHDTLQLKQAQDRISSLNNELKKNIESL